MSVGSKRSIDVAFPDLPEDGQSCKRSWRDGLHSDWTLVVGSATYRVHKVIVGVGDRCSLFLAAAFRKPCGGTSETNLSHTLPEPCWPCFETVLDYMYDNDMDLTSANWAPLFKIADVMQIRLLHQLCSKDIGRVMTIDNAAGICCSVSHVDLGEEICRQVRCLAVDFLASQPFCSLSELLLAEVSTESSAHRDVIMQLLPDILARDDVKVSSEDDIFELVTKVVGGLDEVDAEKLWAVVRLPHLSAKCLTLVANVRWISKLQLAWAVACRGHWAAPIRPLPAGVCFRRPRKSCHRLEFLVADPLSHKQGEKVSSPWRPLDDNFSCRLDVYPRGVGGPKELSAHLTVRGRGTNWSLGDVGLIIQVVNTVGDVRKRARKGCTFHDGSTKVGWGGFLKCDEMTRDSGWLNEIGELCAEAILDLTECKGAWPP